MRLSLFVLLLLVFATEVLVAQPARQDRLDDASIEQSARTLQDAIRSAVSQAGGDIDKQHVHLVLAFSTGHFNKDPLGAQAARQIAWLVVRDLLVAGDKVSCFAWEMGLWDHLQGKANSLILSGSDEESKRLVQDLFPNTVQDGSQGGHDTEKAIVEITRQLGDARDAVIVLLTNDAQSVAPKGQQTIGADNPQYQAVLQTWTRLPQVNESGASVVLPFKVVKVDGSRTDRKLDVVIVVPARFSAGTLVGGVRSDLLRPAPPAAPPKRKTGGWLPAGWLWVLLGIIALAVFGLLAWWGVSNANLRTRQPVVGLKIGNEQIDLTKVADGQTICLLTGENYKPLSGDDAPPVRVAKGTDVVLAELVCRGKDVELELREAELRQINEEWVEAGRTIHLLRTGQPYRLRFVIHKPPKPTMPARKQEVKVHIDWVFADSGKLQNEGG